MKYVDATTRITKPHSPQAKMSMGSWSVLVLLFLFLGAAGYFSYAAWMTDADLPMSDSAYVAIAFGVVVSILVGVVLCPLHRYQCVSHTPAALASPWADRSVA